MFQENIPESSSKKVRAIIMKLARIITGIVLPPVGILMAVGVGPTLLINVLLTILGWLPGSIHALWVIVKHEEQVNRHEESY